MPATRAAPLQALVGHTGFVGANLCRQTRFALRIHRANLESLREACVDRLVISGLPAEKWRINQSPQDDLDNMQRLQSVLATVQAREVVLVSTVDVFGHPVEVDERSRAEPAGLHAYGRHRLAFEDWVRARFDRCCVIRLPGLMGPGLKKNLLFDLLHGHQIERIHPDGQLQWYPLQRLWSDIERALRLQLPLVHAAVEPLRTRDLAARLWPEIELRPSAAPAPNYRMRSIHAEHFGGADGYWMRAEQVWQALAEWRQLGVHEPA